MDTIGGAEEYAYVNDPEWARLFGPEYHWISCRWCDFRTNIASSLRAHNRRAHPLVAVVVEEMRNA